jgi:hypothetical protein
MRAIWLGFLATDRVSEKFQKVGSQGVDLGRVTVMIAFALDEKAGLEPPSAGRKTPKQAGRQWKLANRSRLRDPGRIVAAD